MERLLGEAYPAFLASYARPPFVGLRVNTLKISIEDFQKISPFRLEPVPWAPAGFMIKEGEGESAPGKHPYHTAGLYYLQDPSAMAVARVLDPQPGECVLDLAAAPGGKSTHLAALMGNQGLLICNEIHPKRAWELAENLERCGVTNAGILNETPERLANHFRAFFDRILLDAPCSGEGMFRKSETARQEWSPELVQACAVRQDLILRAAARLVRPGGWLVYSTCTFNPDENERVLAAFLKEHPDFEMAAIAPAAGFAPGFPDWDLSLSGAVRLWPHKVAGEGHFIARLHKHEGEVETSKKKQMRPSLPKEAAGLLRAFWQEALTLPLDLDRLHLSGSYAYALPQDLPDLAGLKVIHPGWWLGTVQKSRCEPAHALGLGLRAANFQRSVTLASESRELAAYLRGESLSSEGENGWLGVLVEPGYPLGWGKRVNGVVKNHYPKGLRRA